MVTDKTRDSYLRRLHGISSDDYDALLAMQNGVCAICKKPPGQGRRLVVDHDHKTGHVRGLLHAWTCNRMLGVVRDDAEWLANAAVYLQVARIVAEYVPGREDYRGSGTSKARRKRISKQRVKR